MMKVSLSLTEQNVEWLRAEAERRGLAVSDIARRTIDEAAAQQAQPIVRRSERGVELLTDNAARHSDVRYLINRMIEIPGPDPEDQFSNEFIAPMQATVAEATLALELQRKELLAAARKVNALETLLEMARHRGLGPDEAIEVLTKKAGEAA